MTECVEIRPNDDGSIDEIVAKNCAIHIEQMDTSGWYIGIEASDGSYWQFWLGARNRRSAVDMRHTETMPKRTDGECVRSAQADDGGSPVNPDQDIARQDEHRDQAALTGARSLGPKEQR